MLNELRKHFIKPLLILDLDNTLIAAVHKDYLDGVYKYPSDFMVINDEIHVNMRPNLHYFMEYAFTNWRVALWTAASEEYTREVLNKSGVDVKNFEFMKFKEDCTKGQDRSFSTIHIKDMNTLSEDLSRVILVDDKSSSAQNLPDNVIEIPAYISAAQSADNKLLKLIDFLEEMKNASDFRSVNKVDWYK